MYLVDHTIVSNPQAPNIRFSSQLLASGREWVILKRLDFNGDSLLDISR